MDDSRVGVIFDVDGVLVDSARPHFESWRQLAQECGGTVTEEQFTATFGRTNRDIIPIVLGEVSEARMQTLGARKEEIYRDLIRESTPIVDGATVLIRALHDAGVLLAVGSSGPRENVDLVLEAMNARDLMSAVVSADDVTRGKPDPQVFTVACERLDLDPGRCVVVEDAPAGIAAARAAGTRTVAVLMHHPAEAFERADCVVSRLAELSGEQLKLLVGKSRGQVKW